jgi:hypothetical protein
MKRVIELVESVRRCHPTDRFFANFLESCKENPFKYRQYKIYDRALMTLDEDSWSTLRQKAIAHYLDHRKGQLKQGFFNQLNEAFAYQFLVRSGFTNVHFLPEKANTKTPDICFVDNANKRYCEVKTLSISDALIQRRAESRVSDGSIYKELDDGFLHKLDSSINQALKQLGSNSCDGIVFLLVNFDDIALDYYKTYRRQLSAFLHNHTAKEVYIKVGIHGRRRLYKKASALSRSRA